LAEALSGGTRYCDPKGLVANVLLAPSSCVDHDALAGAGGPDEDRGALGAGDDLKCVRLLGAEASADPLGDLIAGELAGVDPDVTAALDCECGDPAHDCLLAGAHGKRGHQAALQGEYAAFGDHRAPKVERLVGGEFADGLLEHDGAELAGLECRGAFG
jgi:hypothetical protein